MPDPEYAKSEWDRITADPLTYYPDEEPWVLEEYEPRRRSGLLAATLFLCIALLVFIAWRTA